METFQLIFFARGCAGLCGKNYVYYYSAIYHLHLCVVHIYCLFLLRWCILVTVAVAFCLCSAEVNASAAL
jgi:hypothetical protein